MPMAKMTPEQEAAYALRWGIARSGLPADAQLAYDRLVEQRARAAVSAPVPLPGAEAPRTPVILPRWVAAVGTALVFLIAQGTAVVLPSLARRFGEQYETYRNQVPGWWPRLPRRRP